jgi:hypothetical protein
MEIIGASIESTIVGTNSQLVSSQIANSTVSRTNSALSNSDSIISTVNTGTVPARGNIISNTGSAIVGATKNVGNVIAKDVLPKPEPISTTLLRNKFLSAVVVGGITNAVRGVYKVLKGEYSKEEAVEKVGKDTAVGIATGIGFASGMGLTATALGSVMGSVPLSITGLVIGTIFSIGASEFMNNIVFKPKTTTTQQQ